MEIFLASAHARDRGPNNYDVIFKNRCFYIPARFQRKYRPHTFYCTKCSDEDLIAHLFINATSWHLTVRTQWYTRRTFIFISRADGKEISRQHFLLALADVKAILVKATYTSNSELATLVSSSIDTADPYGDGAPAVHVEQCVCPAGYLGTSCEDCAPGYTRLVLSTQVSYWALTSNDLKCI